MIKKAILASLLALGTGTFLFGTSAWTYMKTAGNELQQSVKSQVPMEFEMRRAEQMVRDLVPEIRRSMHVIAEQQVEVESLQNAVDQRQASLDKQKDSILALREKLNEGDTKYVIAGTSYTQREVEKDLSERFRRFKIAEETLAQEQDILKARQSALRSNEEHLSTLMTAKKDLEAQLAQLDARMRSIKAKEAVSESTLVDQSQLKEVKSLISELSKELDIKERLLEQDVDVSGSIPVEKDLNPDEKISAEVDKYFTEELEDKPL